MEGNCPQCRARLELPASGHYECERCRTRFEVALGAPRPRPAAPPPVAGAAWSGYPPAGYASQPAGYPYYAAAAYAPPPPVNPALQAPCSVHPGNPATGVCDRCGDFMCALCATRIEGRSYCPRCFDLLYNRGSLQFRQRQFTLPGTTLGLGLAACFCYIICPFALLSLPMAVGGVYTGLKALKEHREHPDLPNRTMTLVGLSFSGVAILVGLGLGIFFISMAVFKS